MLDLAFFSGVAKLGSGDEVDAVVKLERLVEGKLGVAVVVGFDVPEVGQRSVDAPEELTADAEIDFLGVVDQLEALSEDGSFSILVVIPDVADGHGGEAKVLGNFTVEIKLAVLVRELDQTEVAEVAVLDRRVPESGAEAESVPGRRDICTGFHHVFAEVDAAENVLGVVAEVDFSFNFCRGIAGRKGGGSGQGANGFAVVANHGFCVWLLLSFLTGPQGGFGEKHYKLSIPRAKAPLDPTFRKSV